MSKARSQPAIRTDHDDSPSCSDGDHDHRQVSFDDATCQRAAAIFRALGDPQRLRLLIMLEARACCVSELANALDEPLAAISQRLRVLKSERIVSSRREGKHVFYSLADGHISRLVTNGVMHAMEES
ncbi:MAG: metalloregulator ArsR/SmtB family transcription factor [Pirellulales bacterium]|nr:metalloregulator ArsR/SmtB family transcription factor [Pirellulales bacterium]